MKIKLDNAFLECYYALEEDRLEDAVKQDMVMFDLAWQLGRDLRITSLTSQ